jgi:two-component system chemotaxis sensor kinase CheA
MTDLAETLWAAFAAETAEHLAAIEPLLVQLGQQPEPADVAALFRAFHSLKGLANAMGCEAMAEVAHHAESLLGLVRDHGAVADDVVLDVLLEGTDALRSLRDAALARQFLSAPQTLIERLQAAFEHAGGAAPPAAEVTPAATSDAGFGDDPEMLALYCEMLRGQLPALASMLFTGEADRSDLADSLDQLAHGAGVLELEALAGQLETLRAALVAHALPLDAAGQGAIRPLLLDLAERAALLAELSGEDTGAAELKAAVTGTLDPALKPALSAFADAMAAGAPEMRRLADELAPRLAPSEGRLFDLLADVVPRLATGALPPSPALAEAIAAVAAGDGAAEAALLAALGAPAAGPLRGPLFDALTSEQRRDADAALAAGQHAYAVTLFLEDTPVVAGKLLAWLQAIGTMPTNRSVFVSGAAWFEILLLTPLAADALLSGLLQHDPDYACLRALRELRPEGDVTIPLDGGAPASAAPQPAAPGGELRVQGAVVDRLMDAIADMRRQIASLGTQLAESGAQDSLARLARSVPVAGAILDAARAERRAALEQLDGLRGQLLRLYAAALEIRIVPIEGALARLPRIVRALAREQGKEIELVLEGREVRVDKTVVDRITEPLMHMVRNAVDHGIEPPEEREAAGKPRRARLTLSAAQAGEQVLVRVADDGRGLDRSRILLRAVERGLVAAEDAPSWTDEAVHRLIFVPGFSTAATVTETSGRGVGMDVVLTEVQRLGGEIETQSSPGQGARFTLRLPLTAATQMAVVVRAGGQSLAVPERSVSLVAEVERETLPMLDGRPCFAVRGEEVPVIGLAALLWPSDRAGRMPGPARLLVVTHEDASVALEVDQVLRRQDLLLLRLHPALAACPGVAGAAVLGDGEVVLLLDPAHLVAAAHATAWRLAS